MVQKIQISDVCRFGLIGGIAKGRDYEKTIADKSQREEIDQCKRWLFENAIKTKTIRRTRTSYGLKHVVENTEGYHYVANGDFIVAALELGYTAVPTSGSSPNCYFNMRILTAKEKAATEHALDKMGDDELSRGIDSVCGD